MLEKLKIDQIIRYGYGGFLIAGIMIFLYPDKSKEFIASAGSVVAPLSILSSGAFIYVFYRYVLGDNFIYPITHFLHFLLDHIINHGNPTSPTSFLGKVKNVKLGQRRQCYTDIRHQLFDHDKRSKLDLDHAEIHVIYLTSVICLFLQIFLSFSNKANEPVKSSLMVITALFWFSAVIIDIRQHKKEGRLIMESSIQQKVDELLTSCGYI